MPFIYPLHPSIAPQPIECTPKTNGREYRSLSGAPPHRRFIGYDDLSSHIDGQGQGNTVHPASIKDRCETTLILFQQLNHREAEPRLNHSKVATRDMQTDQCRWSHFWGQTAQGIYEMRAAEMQACEEPRLSMWETRRITGVRWSP